MLLLKLSITEADLSYLNLLRLSVELTSSAEAAVRVGSVGVRSTVDTRT